jgi:transposase-like protein
VTIFSSSSHLLRILSSDASQTQPQLYGTSYFFVRNTPTGQQDHRFIKRRVKPGLGFFSPETTWNTLQGYESINMIRKGQMRGVEKGDITGQVAFIASLFGVAA